MKKIFTVFLIAVCFFDAGLLLSQSNTSAKIPDLISFRKGDKWGFCDKDKKIIIPVKYNFSLPFVEGLESGKYNNSDILELFLTKTKYKLFEPIEVLFKYINTGLEDDSIYLLFDDNFDYMKFNLKDENGNIYNSKFTPHFDVGFLKPEYIVKPGDTLLAVMQLNPYGIVPRDINSSFLGETGYFPVGVYSGYAFAQNDFVKEFKETLKSNNINFEVEELNVEDKSILELTKNNNLIKINTDYPFNYFSEYTSRIEVRNILVKVLENSIPITKLATAYENFINQYPNSFYSLYYLGSYLNIISHKNKNDIENNMQLLIDKNPSTIVSNFLNNNFMRKIIIDNILENKYK